MEAEGADGRHPRAFRSGETPHLKITTRNLEKLTFTAYKLDPEAYFRKKHALGGVESLDIGLVAPDAEWTVDGPRLRQVQADRDDVRPGQARGAGRLRREGHATRRRSRRRRWSWAATSTRSSRPRASRCSSSPRT